MWGMSSCQWGLAQDKLSHLEKENGRLKDSMIDLQARSMRDNLVWGGIGEIQMKEINKPKVKLETLYALN